MSLSGHYAPNHNKNLSDVMTAQGHLHDKVSTKTVYANHNGSLAVKGHHHSLTNESLQYCPDNVTDWAIDKNLVHQYTCQVPVFNNGTLMSGEYNEGLYCLASTSYCFKLGTIKK